MPLRKIRDFPGVCMSTEHYPPNMMVYDPGEYEWTCPQCGHITLFTIPRITCGDPQVYTLPPNYPRLKESWTGDGPNPWSQTTYCTGPLSEDPGIRRDGSCGC